MKIVLGVSGGIAAYKAPFVLRALAARGAEVRVVRTESAARFVGDATFSGLSGARPISDLWAEPGEVHVSLAAWADALVIAPATANTLAKLAHGLADDALSATALCAACPLVLAPAMHTRMWTHPATRANATALVARGAVLVGPVDGPLASGEQGVGRMAEPEAIAAATIEAARSASRRDLAGRTVLVTAGPTFEALDPVRFLGNRSSGRMGFAIAEVALARGARVVLVSGPVGLEPPRGAEVVRVRSALEMQAAIDAHVDAADAVIMAAAVADYRPREVATHKLKKRAGAPPPPIELVENPDLLAGLGARRAARKETRPCLVGFAVETERLVASAREKCLKKGVDLVVANPAEVAFEGEENEAVLVDAQREEPTGRLTKRALAGRILDRVAAYLTAT